MNRRCYDYKVWCRAQAAHLELMTGRVVHSGGTFDRSRNAEKRSTASERRSALIERMARRRCASWKLERRNPNMGRPYGMPA